MRNHPAKNKMQRGKHIKKRSVQKVSREIVEKAKSISAKTGIEMRYALKVAKGDTTVAAALKEMMIREKAKKLEEKYEIPRNHAMDVAQGKFTVEDALLLIDMQKSPEWRPEQSILIELNENREKCLFYRFGEEPFTAVVEEITKYDCRLASEEGEPREFPKHELMMAAYPDAAEELKKQIGTDEKVKALDLGPSTSYRDRFRSKKRILFKHHRDEIKTRITLRDGSVLTGTIGWFGKWEFLLRVNPRCEVVVFRHALHNFEELNQNGSPVEKKAEPNQKSIAKNVAPKNEEAGNNPVPSKSPVKPAGSSTKQKKKRKKRK